MVLTLLLFESRVALVASLQVLQRCTADRGGSRRGFAFWPCCQSVARCCNVFVASFHQGWAATVWKGGRDGRYVQESFENPTASLAKALQGLEQGLGVPSLACEW